MRETPLDLWSGGFFVYIHQTLFMIDTSAFQGKKAAYYTLGCKLNFSETSTFGKMLEDMGVITAQKGERADICLINTCSVTEVADHKCRQAINRMVRNNPGAFVAVTGCYAQLESERVSKIDGVDLVLGSNEKADLIQFLSDAWTAKESDAEHMQQTGQDSLHRYYSVRSRTSSRLHRHALVATVHVIS